MNTMQLNIDRNQIFGVLQTMDSSDQLDTYKFLKKIVFKEKMENLLQSLKTDELSMEDITSVVEDVRQERYANRRQNV